MTQEQQVTVTRKLLPTPDVGEPDRKTYQIIYRAGELPPRFIYIPEKKYTKELEKKMIKEDLAKRITTPPEIISI